MDNYQDSAHATAYHRECTAHSRKKRGIAECPAHSRKKRGIAECTWHRLGVMYGYIQAIIEGVRIIIEAISCVEVQL